MTLYYAYLEIDTDNRCMAHMLDLPGCTARALGRDKVLIKLPDAIREYHT
jgi:predicted RNase H-like HicB family nuclease